MKKIIFLLVSSFFFFFNLSLQAQNKEKDSQGTYHWETQEVTTEVYPSVVISGKDKKPFILKRLLETLGYEDFSVTARNNRANGWGENKNKSKILVLGESGEVIYSTYIYISKSMENKTSFVLDPTSDITSDDANRLCKAQLAELKKVYRTVVNNPYTVVKTQQVKVYDSVDYVVEENGSGKVKEKTEAEEVEEEPEVESAGIGMTQEEAAAELQPLSPCMQDLKEKFPLEFDQMLRISKYLDQYPNLTLKQVRRLFRQIKDGKARRAFYRCQGYTWWQINRSRVLWVAGSVVAGGAIGYALHKKGEDIKETPPTKPTPPTGPGNGGSDGGTPPSGPGGIANPGWGGTGGSGFGGTYYGSSSGGIGG